MKTRRKLMLGMTGDDVTRLHAALTAVGMEIAEPESEEQRFGTSTEEAVKRIQSLMGVEPTGDVDPAMLELAMAAWGRVTGGTDPAPLDGRYRPEGGGRDAGGMPLGGPTAAARRLVWGETRAPARAQPAPGAPSRPPSALPPPIAGPGAPPRLVAP